MNCKTKFHPPKIIRFYGRWMGLILFVGLPVALLLYVIRDVTAEDQFTGIILCGALLICDLALLFFGGFWEKFFATVKIDDEAITWCCPLRKPIRIERRDCTHVGLAFESGMKMDTYAYIYFTSLDYPPSGKQKKITARSRDGLIKMRYTKELAQFAVSHFSRRVDYSLSNYHHKRLMKTRADHKRS